MKTGIEVAEFGILSPTNDASALATAMTRMYEDEILRKHYQKEGPMRAADFAKPQKIAQFVEMLDKMNEKAIKSIYTE